MKKILLGALLVGLLAAPAVFASICGLAISLILISKKRRNTAK